MVDRAASLVTPEEVGDLVSRARDAEQYHLASILSGMLHAGSVGRLDGLASVIVDWIDRGNPDHPDLAVSVGDLSALTERAKAAGQDELAAILNVVGAVLTMHVERAFGQHIRPFSEVLLAKAIELSEKMGRR